MDLNVIVTAMKKRASAIPTQPEQAKFTAPQLQPLPKQIGIKPGNTATPVEQALTNAGVADGGTQAEPPSDLQMLTESLNNITKLEEMKQKAQLKQPQATNAAASGTTVAQVTGSTPQEQPSPAVAGKSALFGLPAKTASVDAARQVAMLLKKQAAAQQSVSMENSIPASHYMSRVPEEQTRAYLGLKPGSDKAFWRNYYAGEQATQPGEWAYHNMMANAANTAGYHQRYYPYRQEPPWEALKGFSKGLADGTLLPVVPKPKLKAIKK